MTLFAPRSLPPFSQSPTAERIRSQRRPSTTPRRPGQPRKEQSPNVVPIIPAIPLDTLERLAAAGLDAQALLVACREIARFLPAPDATCAKPCNSAPAEGAPDPAWKRRREELKKRGLPTRWRGKLNNASAQVARNNATPPLSVVENINLNSKGESEAQVARNSAPGTMPLPEDWQPTQARYAKAVEVLGEAGAKVMTEKFRNHYGGRPQDLRTARGWQGKYDNWVLSERQDTATPRLPLVRSVKATGPPSTSTVWKLEKAIKECLERRKDSG